MPANTHAHRRVNDNRARKKIKQTNIRRFLPYLTHTITPLFCFMCVGVRFEFDVIDGPFMGFPWLGLGDFELLFSVVCRFGPRCKQHVFFTYLE